MPTSVFSAQELTLPELQSKIQLLQEQTENFQATFDIKMSSKDVPDQEISGKIFVRRPSQMRIDQSRPVHQIIWSDGRSLSVYTPANKQVLKTSWAEWLPQSRFPIPLIDVAGLLPSPENAPKYRPVFVGHTQGLYGIRYEPLDTRDSALTIWYSDESFRPVKGALERLSATTTVEISQLKVNMAGKLGGIAPKVPKNTSIINLVE